MKTVKQEDNESRAKYLVRVAIEMLRDNSYNIDSIVFDEAECDAHCLAEDLEFELNCGHYDKN